MNNSQSSLFQKVLNPINSLVVRLLIMGLGLAHVGLLMWEPTQYAEMIGGFDFAKSMLLIWAMCSSMVTGVGFVPYKAVFKLLFHPYLALIILMSYSFVILMN